jgi:cell division protein FtsW
VGLVLVGSTAAGSGDFSSPLLRRLAWMSFGGAAMAMGCTVNYQTWRRHHVALAILAFVLLAVVLAPAVGSRINNARRWIRFGPIGVQPSEFAKIALLIWLAAYCERNMPAAGRGKGRMGTFQWGFLVPVSIVGTGSFLVLCEPDFGTSVLMGTVCVGVMLVCGTRLVYVLLAGMASLPMLQMLVFNSPYRLQRVLTFLDPWGDPQGAGYQLVQSMIAIGSGGVGGKGLGMGVQKMGFLPGASNDFIFSILAEELGFIGGAVVIGLFMWLLWEGLKVAMRARDAFGFALAFGISTLIALQAAVNIAVATGSVPTKGLSLPFLSAGGSSLFFSMWAAGILMNIARSEEAPERFKLVPWYLDIPAYEHSLARLLRRAGETSGDALRRARGRKAPRRASASATRRRTGK